MSDPLVFYDGWALSYQPNSPAALHLLTLLNLHPHGIRAQVGLPARADIALPGGIEAIDGAPRDGAWSRLAWEQHVLPGLARRSRAVWLHTFSGAALFGGCRRLVSPAAEWEYGAGKKGALAGRLRDALAQGGAARARLAWPVALPQADKPVYTGQAAGLPLAVPPDWLAAGNSPPPVLSVPPVLSAPPVLPDLPESYLLYHGPLSEAALRPALQAWSWAAGAIGEYFPLLLVGFEGAPSGAPLQPGSRGEQIESVLPSQVSANVSALAAEYGVEKSTRLLPPLSPDALRAVYRGSSVIFHPGEAEPWGDPALLALACGRPLVGLETRRMAAFSGPAAYLVAGEQAQDAGRLLGAGLITLVVEDAVAEALASQARQRAAAWQPAAFTQALAELYRAN